ncbi:MAG: hypothetical protein Q9160_004440 [Pyrenula sp. 1 TL-2023]
MSSRSIVELAAVIQANTGKVFEDLKSQGIAPPSFDVSSPPVLNLSTKAIAAQKDALEALDELRVHLMGPLVHATAHEHPMMGLASIQRYDIAKAVPVNGTATFAEIAERCSLHEDDVKRILRYTMTHYYFREPSKEVVEHTASSRVLAEVPLANQMLGFSCGELWPGAMQLVNAIKKWPGSEEPTECGWVLANNTDRKAYDIIEADPIRAKRMADAMSFQQSAPHFNNTHLLSSYDWGSVSRGILVDVGGSYGDVAKAIARHFPDMKCVVQDLREVIIKAEVPADLTTRLTFVEHDFFTEQPVKGADVYLLRWILHNWSDKYTIQILRNLIPALKRGSRVLVSESCLPTHGSGASPFKARYPRALDIYMKQLLNSREREEEDWKHLFERAHPNFRFSVRTPPNGGMSIIEAIWEG